MAESLYEAAALGLKRLVSAELIESLPVPQMSLEIEVREAPTRHQLTVKGVRDYTQATLTGPAERLKRERIRALLAYRSHWTSGPITSQASRARNLPNFRTKRNPRPQ
jgi:hypothetical protein